MQIFPTISPYIYGGLMGVWLLFFLLGKRQFDQARQLTLDLALSKVKAARKSNPEMTVDQYYGALLPEWETRIKEKIKFIPHKLEIWPMPAKPDYVRSRLNFTPEWLGAYLKVNGVILPATESQQARIDEIAALSQKIARKSN
jgi:hypothetical protein